MERDADDVHAALTPVELGGLALSARPSAQFIRATRSRSLSASSGALRHSLHQGPVVDGSWPAGHLAKRSIGMRVHCFQILGFRKRRPSRTIVCAAIVGLVLLPAIARAAPQAVATERIEGVIVQVLVEGGKLLLGANDIVLELHSSGGPSDVSDVILIAARPGEPAESLRIDLSPDGGGRFHGTLTLPWTGNWRMEVAWHDEHGQHRHDFTVPVVAGHH
jgi:FixH protein